MGYRRLSSSLASYFMDMDYVIAVDTQTIVVCSGYELCHGGYVNPSSL